jgi:hypothetical protein
MIAIARADVNTREEGLVISIPFAMRMGRSQWDGSPPAPRLVVGVLYAPYRHMASLDVYEVSPQGHSPSGIVEESARDHWNSDADTELRADAETTQNYPPQLRVVLIGIDLTDAGEQQFEKQDLLSHE